MATFYNPSYVMPNNRFDKIQGTARATDNSVTSADHPLTTIVGPPQIRSPVLAESLRYENRYQYPTATEGNVLQLTPVILGLITDPSQNQSFLLRILPVEITDASEITWDVFEFAEGIAQVLSEEAVPHVLKFTQRSDFAKVERKGIAIRGESNFLYTPMGQSLIMKQVVQMTRACRESQDVDTIFTIMATDGRDYTDMYNKGMFSYDWDILLSIKNAETFCLQKRTNNAEQMPLIKLIDHRKELLISRGAGTPNHLIMCRGAEPYLHGIGQDNSYAVAGPEGPERAKQNMFASVSTFRGMEVNYLKRYVLERGKAPQDFLTTPCTAGEFYLLPAGSVDDRDKALAVYDFTAKRWKSYSRELLSEKATELAEACSVPVVDPTYQDMHLMLVRPFFQTVAGHAVILRGGPSLGNNFVGSHSNFEWADNAADQTKFGTFAFYSKAVIFNPLHVTHLKNILCKSYIGGGGTDFFSKADLDDIAIDNWTPYITKRHPSAFVIPIEATQDVPQHLPLSGHFADDTLTTERYKTLPFLRENLGFDKAVTKHALQTFYDPNLMSVSNNGLQSPLIVSMGYHRLQDKGGNWRHVLGDSFLGNNIYDGCEKVLDGIVPCFKEQNYESQTSLKDFRPESVRVADFKDALSRYTLFMNGLQAGRAGGLVNAVANIIVDPLVAVANAGGAAIAV